MTANLSRLLSEIRVPVYVLDDQRTVVYVNAAFESWLNVDGETLLGRRCDYGSAASKDRIDAILSAICPPPTAFAGETTQGLLLCPLQGQTTSRRTRFVPLGEDDVECEGVLAIVAAEECVGSTQAVDATDSDGAFQNLHRQLQVFRQTYAGRYRLDRLVGKSAAMPRVQRQGMLAIAKTARTMVTRPPGSGSEHLARTIHFAGDDARAPTLMPLACPLLDAELFQSSITAFARHAAENPSTRPPTVLLCDVDQLTEGAQAELAGFLALPGFELHMLATSRASLLELATAGTFRPSLAYALSTLEIHLPPLSERKQDIPLLAQTFVEEHNVETAEASIDSQRAGFEPAALDLLCEHTWDENVDQLRDVIHSACEAAVGSQITCDDLPEEIPTAAKVPTSSREEEEPIVLDEVLADVEAEMIRRAMRLAKGNKTKAAELLGISRPRLHRRWEEMDGE